MSHRLAGVGVEFRVLGPIEALLDGRQMDLGPSKRRLLLALLVLETGRPVALERLIDLAWEEPPPSARRVVFSHITRLRQALADAAPHGVELVNTGPGYCLRVDPADVDVHRFRRLTSSAETTVDPVIRADLLRQALDVWRGPALADVTLSPGAERLGRSLDELRLNAIENRVEADLAAGRHAAVVPELVELMAQHPLRERLGAGLMLALYRGGSTSRALEVYGRIRADLAADLGLDPGLSLTALYGRILRGDASLILDQPPATLTVTGRPPAATAPVATALSAAVTHGVATTDALATDALATDGAVTDGVATDGAVTDGVATDGVATDGAVTDGVATDGVATDAVAGAAGTAVPADAVPAQLPPGVAGFTGRAEYLEILDALLGRGGDGSAVPIAVIVGGAGVGKTSLAVRWARRVSDRFPDGQLYVNLRGFDPGGIVMTPDQAVRWFLEALHVPSDRVPAGVDAQTALYRSLLAGKRMLVVLDNAATAEQVRPLLPGEPGCFVVVTTRRQLTSLMAVEGAQAVPLELPPVEESRELLLSRLGASVAAAEPAVVDEIVELCARLPLALAVVGARAAANPRLALASLATELRSDRVVLEGLSGGDPASDVRSVLSWSYHKLEPEQARLFRLLGLHPGPDIATAAAASLAGMTVGEVRPLLAELVRSNQIAEHAHGRFGFHDLLRAYAFDLSSTVDTEADRLAALERMDDHYLHTAHAADRLINPHREPIAIGEPRPRVTPEVLTGMDEAMGWFTAEYPVLRGILGRAAAAGLDDHTWPLPWTLLAFYEFRGHRQDQDTALEIALATAERRADPAMLARAHRSAAVVYVRRGRYDEMDQHLSRAMAIYRDLGDRPGLAHAHSLAGGSLMFRGRTAEALVQFERCLELHSAVGDRVNEANALNAVGWCHTLLGDHERAIVHCERAVAVLQELGDVGGVAATMDTIGHARQSLGQHEEAARCYREALAGSTASGDRYQESNVLDHIGDNELARGSAATAVTAWRAALSILDELEHPGAAAVRAKVTEHGRDQAG